MYRQKRRAEAITLYLNLKPTDSVLDIGCGEGFVVAHLSGAHLVVGLDLSKYSLMAGTKNTQQSSINFVLADITALPIKSAEFDKIMLLEVLEHLTEEKQKQVLNEINRVQKTKGVLLVSVPYKENITLTTCTHCGELTPLWGHLCSFDEKKLSCILPKNYRLINKWYLPNIAIISLSRFFQYFPIRAWLAINRLLGLYRKGYWLIMKLQKNE